MFNKNKKYSFNSKENQGIILFLATDYYINQLKELNIDTSKFELELKGKTEEQIYNELGSGSCEFTLLLDKHDIPVY